MTTVELRSVNPEDRPIVEHPWQLYRHDLSEFRGEHTPEGIRGTLPGEDGTFNARGLLPFLEADPDRAAYLFYRGASPVGFVLVSGLAARSRLMSEFFVVRGARRQGVAGAAVRELLARHPGEWEIPFQDNNVAAARFWRAMAIDVAGDAVREELRPVPNKPEIPPDVWITLTVV